MTRKDFILIADALARARPPEFQDDDCRADLKVQTLQWGIGVREIAMAMGIYPNFDRTRFLIHCIDGKPVPGSALAK